MTEIPQDPAGWLTAVRAAERAGDVLRAYDLALQGVHRHPGDLALQHRAVLTVARAGGRRQAWEHLRAFGFSAAAADEDIACLEPRLVKDEALAMGRADLARRSAELYRQVFERTGGYYPGINAATMARLAGDRALAQDLARRTLAALGDLRADAPDAFYRQATAAEASLLLDDVAATARHAAQAAAVAGTDAAARATAWKQLLRVARHAGADPAILAPLKPPAVLHFTGHRIAAPGCGGRFAAASEAAVAARIAAYLDARPVGYAYGALASGGDILFAEGLLARDARLHVVLPFDVADFKAVSVVDSGPGWAERFDRCLAQAHAVSYATEGRYLGHPGIFVYAARFAMGLAAMQAAALDTDVEQAAVWDGIDAPDAAGTGGDVAFWRSLGRPTQVIDCGPRADGPVIRSPEPEPAPTTQPRVPRALLFGDVKGFSKLDDAQIPAFFDAVMGRIGRALARHDTDILYRNTWGDGLYVVMSGAAAAARCALDVQREMGAIDFSVLPLPSTLELRIGAHFGPVYEGVDPVTGRPNFTGAHVSRTARIEPVTPPGQVYVSEPFAAALALADPDARFEYVGIVPAAKGYGEMRMFLLLPPGAR